MKIRPWLCGGPSGLWLVTLLVGLHLGMSVESTDLALTPPERSLAITSNDVLQIFLSQVPKTYQQSALVQGVVTCRHRQRPAVQFYLKIRQKTSEKNKNEILFVITLTNTLKLSPETVGSFNTFYRIVIPADSSRESLVTKAQQLFQVSDPASNSGGFLAELEKQAPLTMAEMFKTPTVQTLLTQVLQTPQTYTTKNGLLSRGKCAGHADKLCSVHIYSIDGKLAGMVTWITGRSIAITFPLANFEETFKGLLPTYTQELNELLAKETPEGKSSLSFEAFVGTLGEALGEVCANCHTKTKLSKSESFHNGFVNVFAIQKDTVSSPKEGEAPVKGKEAVQSIFAALYYSFGRMQFSLALFDNERVRKDLFLPLHQSELKKRVVQEGKHFVTLTQGEPENETKEVFIGVPQLRALFDKIIGSCDGGTVVPGADEKAPFLVKCGDLPVVRVSDYFSDRESCVKIDFLVLKSKDPEASMSTGFILSKASIFDALPKIEPDLVAYLESFKG